MRSSGLPSTVCTAYTSVPGSFVLIWATVSATSLSNPSALSGSLHVKRTLRPNILPPPLSLGISPAVPIVSLQYMKLHVLIVSVTYFEYHALCRGFTTSADARRPSDGHPQGTREDHLRARLS